MFDRLRGLPEFQQLQKEYTSHLEPMRKRVLEAKKSAEWEKLRQRTYKWVSGEAI